MAVPPETLRVEFDRVVRQDVVRYATRYLGRLRRLLLDSESLEQLVRQGYTPQQIRLAFPTHEALRKAFRSLYIDVVHSVVGLAVVQIAVQLTDARFEARPDSASSTTEKSLPPPMSTLHIHRFPPLSHEKLLTFIEDEMTNGALVGDPAWHEEMHSKRRKRRVGWYVMMQDSLGEMKEEFDQSACEIDWWTVVQANEDVRVIRSLSNEDFTALVRSSYAKMPIHLAAGPAKEVDVITRDATEEEKAVLQLGKHFCTLARTSSSSFPLPP